MNSSTRLHQPRLSKRRIVLTMGVMLGAMIAIGCPAQTNEAIVNQFFPQRLVDAEREFRRGNRPPVRLSEFVLADLDGTGASNFIAAAYSNGVLGAVRVIRLQSGTATLADEPQLPLMNGGSPAMRLIDLDGDNRPEVVASFSSVKGYMTDWVLKWNGTRLQFLGPSTVRQDGDEESLLVESDFWDVDGDGKMEIVVGPLRSPLPEGDRVPPDEVVVYKLDATGRYVSFKTLVFFAVFERTTGSPITSTRTIFAARTDIQYVLTVKNGDAKGEHRTSSATIRINGIVVLPPDALNQQIAEFTNTISLQQTNTLVAEVAAKPTGMIMVMIEPKP